VLRVSSGFQTFENNISCFWKFDEALALVFGHKTRFFDVLHFDKTWVLDQSERTQGPSSLIKYKNKSCFKTSHLDGDGGGFLKKRQVSPTKRADSCIVHEFGLPFSVDDFHGMTKI